ncbi:class C sortase [Nocardioides sp. AN3]
MTTHTLRRPRPGAPTRGHRRGRSRTATALGTWGARRVCVVLIALTGISVLLFPSAATWLSDRTQHAAIGGYVDTVRGMTPEATRTALAAAHDYNRHLVAGPLLDPYTATSDARVPSADPVYQTYLHTLDVGGDEIMGYVAAPEIGLSLPIYHGTAPATLDRGIGHLYGTALPVGGPGTHSVLTGHSGLVRSTMFTNIRKLRRGDEFTVTVLDHTLTYRVDQIRTVLPEDTDALRAVAGKDYVTLVTCTPIGVNSHRLLVRGVRVAGDAGSSQQVSVGGRAAGAGFPWWLLLAVFALLVVLFATRPLGPRRGPAADA